MANIIRVFLCYGVLFSVVKSDDFTDPHVVHMQQGVDDESQNTIDSPGNLDQLQGTSSMTPDSVNNDREQDKTSVVNQVDESTNDNNEDKSDGSNSEHESGYREPNTVDMNATESPKQPTPNITPNTHKCESTDESCDNEENYISSDCNCTDPENWAHFGTCNPEETGVDISLAWCPRFIHNYTVCPNFTIKSNKFHTTGTKTWSKGNVAVTVLIPEFNRAIYKDTTEQKCKDIVKKLPVPSALQSFLCPFNLNFIEAKFPVNETKIYPNPFGNKLPTLPAGSYHLQSNISNDDGSLFACLDGWIEFKI